MMRRLQMALMVAVMAGLLAGPALAMTNFEKGNDLYAKGQFHAASDAYIDAICAKPRFYPAHYQLANTLMKLGKCEEAQNEYEMCLEMYPDAKTKAMCHKALRYLTGTSTGRAAVINRPDGNTLDYSLAAEGERRNAIEAKNAENERLKIEKAAVAQADQIKADAKAQVESMKMNAPVWRMDVETNSRVPMVPIDVQNAVLDRGNANAAKAIDMAREKAQSVAPKNGADVTDGLRSQIYPSGNSSVRLNPVGTSVYVRNYQSSHVADTSSGVK